MTKMMASSFGKPTGFTWRSAVLIGAGRMGRAHALALQQLGVPLAAVADVGDDARNRIGEEFAVPPAARFASAEGLLEANPNADLVVVATTADAHRDLVCHAAMAGARNVLCEKPMATSVADCEAMIAASAASGTHLAINHQMRFMDQYLAVKREFAGGALGRLASMTVVAGCFGLAMNGSHYVEAFSFLTGGTPIEASGWFSGEAFTNPRGPQFRDQAGEFRILADTGQRLTLVIGADQGHGMTTMYAGAYGHMFIDELEGEGFVVTRLPEHRVQPPTRYGMPWERRAIRFERADNVGPTRAVMEALAAGKGYPTGEDGRRVVATLAACYASAEGGSRPVRLAELDEGRTHRFPWA